MPSKTSTNSPKVRTARYRKKLSSTLEDHGAPMSVYEIAKDTSWSVTMARRRAEKHLHKSLNRDHRKGEGPVHRFATFKMVKENADTLGIARIGDGYYHIRKDIKQAFLYIIKMKDDGLTLHESNLLVRLNRSDVLEPLANHRKVEVVEFEGERVWIWKPKKKSQLNRRRTNHLFWKKKQMEEALERGEPIPIPVDEIIDTIEHLWEESYGSRLKMVVRFALLKHFRGWSDRRAAKEMRHAIRRDHQASQLPALDHSTISRMFRDADEGYQKEVERWLILELIQKKAITMQSLAGDSTHLDACCSERKISKGGIEGAAWGFHGDFFYGYKLHTIVDSNSELPVSWTLTPGNEADISQLDALVDAFTTSYPEAAPEILTLDAGYDHSEAKMRAESGLGCAVISARNPRRNKHFQKAKEAVSKMWKLWGGKLKSVESYLKRISQKILTELSEAVKHSVMAELVRNLMFMDRRVAVERYFGRLKQFTMVTRLVHQSFEEVRKFVRWAIIAMLAFSLTMVERGIPSAHLKYGAIV
jgi:hypothetical protein